MFSLTFQSIYLVSTREEYLAENSPQLTNGKIFSELRFWFAILKRFIVVDSDNENGRTVPAGPLINQTSSDLSPF